MFIRCTGVIILSGTLVQLVWLEVNGLWKALLYCLPGIMEVLWTSVYFLNYQGYALPFLQFPEFMNSGIEG